MSLESRISQAYSDKLNKLKKEVFLHASTKTIKELNTYFISESSGERNQYAIVGGNEVRVIIHDEIPFPYFSVSTDKKLIFSKKN